MLLILGGSGYVGSKYRKFLYSSGVKFASFSRKDADYTRPEVLDEIVRTHRPYFLINAAGYTGKPNVDACESDKVATLAGNAVFPGVVREVCERHKVRWGHVSSGCIYSGRRPDGGGWREDDPPNFCFRTNNSSFYSGTKALGEEVLAGAESCYVWRLRIPFNNEDSPRNYITKIMTYERVFEAENSVSHLDEFVRVTCECFQKGVPYGIYNVTNPGSVMTSDVTRWIVEEAQRKDSINFPCSFRRSFSFFSDEDEFMRVAAKTPRSNCVLDSSKLESVGIRMTPVEEAFRKSLEAWV